MATEAPEAKEDFLAKEIELLLLASNDPETRSDVIKEIKKLLLKHSEDTSDAFQLNDYLIIWRGLFYYLWTSDKPVPQESVTENISNLIHSCTSYHGKILFLDAFFLTINDNWMSIKQDHIDNCMMLLLRHCLRQLLFTFVDCDWNLEYMNKFSEVLYRALKSFTHSLRTDLQVIFLEELAKVSRGNLPSEALVIILDSFLHYTSELKDFMLIREVTQNVFRNLLSKSPDLETEAKFQALEKVVDPGNSYRGLELVEGDIKNDSSNEINYITTDHQVGNVSVELPRIKFNPKDVAKILNKYVTEVDCTRMCLLELTKLLTFYNRLGDCILPNKPKDLKINSEVLKEKKEKNLPKMVREGVINLEKVDSMIKKSGLKVYDHKSLKELEKMGEIVEREELGKRMWKVRKFDNVNTFEEILNSNGPSTITKETKIDSTNTWFINDDKPPILVPAGFNFMETTEKTPTKVQKKVSLTPNLKSLTVDSSLKKPYCNKRKSKSKISKMNDGSNNKNTKTPNSCSIKIGKPNALNVSHNNSLSMSADPGISASKKVKNSIEFEKAVQSVNVSPLNNKSFMPDNKIDEKNQIDDEPPLLMPAVYNNKVSNAPEKTPTKVQKKVSLTPNLKSLTVDSSLKKPYCNKRKSKSKISKMNDGSNNKNTKTPNSCSIKIGKPNALNVSHNNSLSMSADHGRSASKKVKNSIEFAKAVQSVNVSPLNNKSFMPENKIDEKNQIDDEPPLLMPAVYNNKVSNAPEKTLTKLQKKVPLTPNLKLFKKDSSLKELIMPDEIVVEERKIKKRAWNVRNFDNVNILKKNFNSNGSWTISKETEIDGTNTVCNNDDKPLFLVPAGFKVQVMKTPEKTPTKDQKKISLTPNLKSLTVDSSLKELNEMGEIEGERAKIGKVVWKVSKFDNDDTLIENFKLNGSWTITDETKIDGTNAVCINDDEPPLMVPVGCNIEVSDAPEKALTKLQKKVPLTPNLKLFKKDSSLKELIMPDEIVVEERKIKKWAWNVRNFDNVNILKKNFNSNGSWTISKETEIDGTNTVCNNDDKPLFLVPAGFKVQVMKTPEKTPTKDQKKISLTPNLKSLTVDSSLKELNEMGKIEGERAKIGKFMWKVSKFDNDDTLIENFKLNGSWTITDETKIDGTNAVCINDDEPPLMVPAGCNIEVSDAPEKALTKLQKNVSLTPNLKSLTIDSSLKELNEMGKIEGERAKIGKFMWKVSKFDNDDTLMENFKLNGQWTITNETKIDSTNAVCINDDEPPLMVPAGCNIEVSDAPEKALTKLQKNVFLTPNLKSLTVDSSVKELNKMGEIEEEHIKIGKLMWKVSKFDNDSSLKENFKLNGSWTITNESKIDSTNTGCNNDDEPPLMVLAGCNIEVLDAPEKALKKKLQKKVSLTLNFKYLTVDLSLKKSNFNKHKSKGQISKMNDGSNKTNSKNQNSRSFKIGRPNALNASDNNSWSISADHGGSPSKELKNNIESAKAVQSVNASSFNNKSLTSDKEIKKKNKIVDFVTSKVKLCSNKIDINSSLNDSRSMCSDEKLKSSKFKSPVPNTALEPKDKSNQRSNSLFDKICSPNIVDTSRNNSWPVAADIDDSVTFVQRVLRPRTTIIPQNERHVQNKGTPETKVKEISATKVLRAHRKTISGYKPGKVGKSISLTSGITPDKSLESPKSPTFVQRLLRPRTIIQKNERDGQNKGTPKTKLKETSTSKVLRARKKTISGYKPDKVGKSISFSSFITPDKSLESPKSPTFVQRLLRPRTIIIPKNERDGQNKDTPETKVKEISATKVLRAHRKTISGYKPGKVGKSISLTSGITPVKSLESPKNPTLVQRVLRPRTIIIPKNERDGQNKGTPETKVKEISATKVLRAHRKTISGYKSGKVEKSISLISVITPAKSLKSPKSPTIVQRVLRPRTTIIPKNERDGQNKGTPETKVKEISATKVLRAHRKTISGYKSGKVGKSISLTSGITPDKSLESPKSPTIVQRVLRPRTTIIQKNERDGQYKGTSKRRVKETSATKVLQKRRKTIAGGEISMLKLEDISNKALVKVRNEAFEDDFGSLRKSPRLSTLTDSAKKRVEYQC